MTTSYADKDYWSGREKGLSWTNYHTAYPYPIAEELEEALEAATEIMNDTVHIGCGSSNVSSTAYVSRLKGINYDMANRILSVKANRQNQGAVYMFSLQDFLFTYERNFLIDISKVLGHKLVGKWVF